METMVERTLGRCVGQGRGRRRNQTLGNETDDIARKKHGLYLELPHLLQLEPEFGHTPPHVEQAHVDGRGAGDQGLAGRPRRLQGAESLSARNMGTSYGKRAAKHLRMPESKVQAQSHPNTDDWSL